MDLESPRSLLTRLKLGREEYCQRLLTMLILDAPYPKWNSVNVPSTRGKQFLRDLDDMSFGSHERENPIAFVDEFDLPKRPDEADGGACDWAVVWPARLWLIELKTEVGSWRADQLPKYFDLGAHHHPARHLDVTYLTPPMSHRLTSVPPDAHFGHLVWADVARLMQDTWSDGSPWHRDAVATLLDVLSDLGSPWSAARATRMTVNDAIDLAGSVAADGQQRALDIEPSGLDDLYSWRQRVDTALRSAPNDSPLRSVRPWVWNAATSGGVAITQAGAAHGYELRLSRYVTPT